MDSEKSSLCAPTGELDTMLDDLRRLITSCDNGDLIKEDEITGLSSSEPAIEGLSGYLQDQDLEALTRLESEGHLQELNHLNNWLLSENESWKLGLSPSAQDPGNELQACVDLDQPEPLQFQSYHGPLNSQSTSCSFMGKPNEVWSESGHVFQSSQFQVNTRVSREVQGDRHEQDHSIRFSTCKICLSYYAIDRVESPCGHIFCRSCLSRWLEDGARPCPQCSTLLRMSANISPSYASAKGNVESIKDHEFEYAPQSMIYQQGCQPPLAHSQGFDTVQPGSRGLNRAALGLTQECQPVHLEVLQPESGNQGDPLHVSPLNEALAESRPSVDAIKSEKQSSRKRRREKTFAVDLDGVAMRFDGVEERFTAYFRPSYWTEDDSAVFLGEYPTFEEAKDAHNLVTLLHEGPHAQMDLAPFTADKYAEELKRWEGKHHVDVVCELRLRGRGLSKDGSVNYKHVGRRLSRKSTGKICTSFFSTVPDDPDQSSNAMARKPIRASLRTFDTPEEAARHADQVLVKQKGVGAWTNFPLSSYITSADELPLTFLPLSNNFRENLTNKRDGNYWRVPNS